MLPLERHGHSETLVGILLLVVIVDKIKSQYNEKEHKIKLEG